MTIDKDSGDPGEERSLLEAAHAGDQRAFGRLASRYGPGLALFCELMLGCPHAAHDAVCEALLRGWRELPDGMQPASARIWLYRLATDVCLEDLGATDESGGLRPFDGVRDTNERPR
jgi:DNA-directed RNA polymerase specialized sigma24 family protein